MNQDEIKKILPQREPMLMVEDILEITPGEAVTGYKKVRGNEFWAKGHFPGNPVFPGVLLIEHMAQVSLFLAYQADGPAFRRVYLAKVDQVKFLTPVAPGMELYTEVKKIMESGGFIKASAVVYIGSEKKERAAVGKLTCYLETGSEANVEGGTCDGEVG